MEARTPAGGVPASDASPHAALLQLLAHPSIASKHWIYRQYDHMVRAGAMVLPGSDAAVFLIREANKILAATSDCNGLYCALDPREGARIAVAEAARNLTCAGAVPLAVTDNLNFGNPYNPENFWQLRECVEGLAEGCREFKTPVTGGNVSLYNQSPAGSIDPTPTVGMVGLIAEAKHVTTQYFKDEGDVIILAGELLGGPKDDPLGASHFLKVIHGRKEGRVPRVDYPRELDLQEAVRELIYAGLVKSAHDCSEGGLAVALAECCISHPETRLGATIRLEAGGRLDALLFHEAQSRIVLSTGATDAEAVLKALKERGVRGTQLGVVGGQQLSIIAGDSELTWSVEELRAPWFSSIGDAMRGGATA